MKKLNKLWTKACAHANAHRAAYHHCLHASHTAYLFTVVLHGPYTISAFVCLIIIGVGYIFKLEVPTEGEITYIPTSSPPVHEKVNATPRLG